MYNGVGKDNMGYYGLLWVSDIINKYIVTHRNLYELIGTHYLYQYKLMPQATPNHQQKNSARLKAERNIKDKCYCRAIATEHH